MVNILLKVVGYVFDLKLCTGGGLYFYSILHCVQVVDYIFILSYTVYRWWIIFLAYLTLCNSVICDILI